MRLLNVVTVHPSTLDSLAGQYVPPERPIKHVPPAWRRLDQRVVVVALRLAKGDHSRIRRDGSALVVLNPGVIA